MWCTQCRLIGKEECVKKGHSTHKYHQYFAKTLASVESRLEKFAPTWEEIITNRRKLQDLYQHLYRFISSMQTKLKKKMKANSTYLDIATSHKEEPSDFARISPCDDYTDEFMATEMKRLVEFSSKYVTFRREANLNLTSDFLDISCLIIESIDVKFDCDCASRLDEWKDEADLPSAKEELNSLLMIEEHCIQAEVVNARVPRNCMRNVDLLRKLPLSFSGLGHPPPIDGKSGSLSAVHHD